jgi:hypothetical protein
MVATVNRRGSCGQRVRRVPVVLSDACQEAVEVGSGELPAEGPGGDVVKLLEGQDLGGELIEVLEVVGGEELALDDGEVDLVG